MSVVLLILGTLVGCGPNCNSTCQALYGDQPNCQIQRGGKSQTELLSDCQNYCEEALKHPGDLGDYQPYEAIGSTQSVELENEKQAAMWMECVSEMSCDRLTDGYCAPVW